MAEAIQKTFDVPGDSQLVVENIKGPITITGWDRPQAEVTATPEQDWAEIEIEQHDHKVVARTKTEQGQPRWMNWFNSSQTPHVEYSVKVPYATDIHVKNVEGPIAVRHCKGKIRINTVEGKVTLDHVQGDMRAETVNGALSASHVNGAPQFKTVNGKLKVQESELSGLSAHTVNGKIKAAATWAADAQISLHTVNGDCELTVPADFRAKASAHGINVSVTLGKAKTITRQFSGWHGTIGPQAESADAPQAEISFHTVNGHLRVDDSAPAAGTSTAFAKQAASAPEPVQVKVAPAPAEAPVEKEPTKSQLDILQMVERGEITVQEALEILEA
jgi:hypothetical protein